MMWGCARPLSSLCTWNSTPRCRTFVLKPGSIARDSRGAAGAECAGRSRPFQRPDPAAQTCRRIGRTKRVLKPAPAQRAGAGRRDSVCSRRALSAACRRARARAGRGRGGRHPPARGRASAALPGVGAAATKSAALSFVSTSANCRATLCPAGGSTAGAPSPAFTSVGSEDSVAERVEHPARARAARPSRARSGSRSRAAGRRRPPA